MVTHMECYLSLGSNVGHPETNLFRALEELQLVPEITMRATSSVYRTEPQGLREQAWFANQVVHISTGLSADELLDKLHTIESKLGRTREVKWGPRTIDMDILLFGEYVCTSEKLQIPHPRMCERAFVLVPLAELNPDLRINGRSIFQWLETIRFSAQDDIIRQPEEQPRTEVHDV